MTQIGASILMSAILSLSRDRVADRLGEGEEDIRTGRRSPPMPWIVGRCGRIP